VREPAIAREKLLQEFLPASQLRDSVREIIDPLLQVT